MGHRGVCSTFVIRVLVLLPHEFPQCPNAAIVVGAWPVLLALGYKPTNPRAGTAQLFGMMPVTSRPYKMSRRHNPSGAALTATDL